MPTCSHSESTAGLEQHGADDYGETTCIPERVASVRRMIKHQATGRLKVIT